jgi:uncharacterized membrane protein YgdD (TMEM256/DUF423 family)
MKEILKSLCTLHNKYPDSPFPADHQPPLTMPILDPVAISRIGASYGNVPIPITSFCDDNNNPCQLTISDEFICQTSLIFFLSFLLLPHPLANEKGFISVALGAFGAHGLQKTVTDPKLIHVPPLPSPISLPLPSAADVQNWETASTYLMFNGLAMLAISGHPRLASKRFAAGAIAVGSALFSGSIYALVLWRSRGKTGGSDSLGGTYYACWMGSFDSIRNGVI